MARAPKLAGSAEQAKDVHAVRLVFAELGVNAERWDVAQGGREGDLLSLVSESRPGAPIFVRIDAGEKVRWVSNTFSWGLMRCEKQVVHSHSTPESRSVQDDTSWYLKILRTKSNCGSFDCVQDDTGLGRFVLSHPWRRKTETRQGWGTPFRADLRDGTPSVDQ